MSDIPLRVVVDEWALPVPPLTGVTAGALQAIYGILTLDEARAGMGMLLAVITS